MLISIPGAKMRQHITKLMCYSVLHYRLLSSAEPKGKPVGFVYSAIKQEGSFVSVLIGLQWV